MKIFDYFIVNKSAASKISARRASMILGWTSIWFSVLPAIVFMAALKSGEEVMSIASWDKLIIISLVGFPPIGIVAGIIGIFISEDNREAKTGLGLCLVLGVGFWMVDYLIAVGTPTGH